MEATGVTFLPPQEVLVEGDLTGTLMHPLPVTLFLQVRDLQPALMVRPKDLPVQHIVPQTLRMERVEVVALVVRQQDPVLPVRGMADQDAKALSLERLSSMRAAVVAEITAPDPQVSAPTVVEMVLPLRQLSSLSSMEMPTLVVAAAVVVEPMLTPVQADLADLA